MEALAELLDGINAIRTEVQTCTAKLSRSEAIFAAQQLAGQKWQQYRSDVLAKHGNRREPCFYHFSYIHGGKGYCWETSDGWKVSPNQPRLDEVDDFLEVNARGTVVPCSRRPLIPLSVDPLNEIARGAQGVRWTGD